MLSKEEFIDQLRDALNHLYHPEHLRQSPLAALFGVANRFDTGSALQRILIEAINSLEPSPNEPHHSQAWQIYEPLFYRYVEQLSAEEVANQMAISDRHLRRKQQAALDVLAEVLWRQHDLKDRIEAKQAHDSASAIVNEELAWVKETASNSSANLEESFQAVLNLAQKLADHHRVNLEMTRERTFPILAVDPVALRQMLLNVLHVAIPRAAGGSVQIAVRALQWEVEIHIECPAYPSGHKPALDDETANLNMAQQLADLSGCKLRLSVDNRSFDVTLTIAALEQLPVLAIDDNLDALQMLSRYASGTRYHLVVSSDPEQALKAAETLQPRAIVMDVMMPHVDGWELIQRFRQNPPTADIPIIVCTILAQKDLALLLGANGFLRKPISRQSFLDALDQCTVLTGSG